MRVRVRVAQLLLLPLLLITLPLWRRAPAEATVASSVVAIEISGAARGRSSLAATAAALGSHVMQPAAGRGFTVLVWLEDAPSEAFLESAFGRTPTLTRLRAQSQLPPDLSTPTDALLAAAGLPEALGRVERNTLRMLRKMAGCEWLRRHAEAERAFPSATLVLRTRPDLLLTAPLPLPPTLPASASAVYAPWHCASAGLAFDRLAEMTTRDYPRLPETTRDYPRLGLAFDQLLAATAASAPLLQRLFGEALANASSGALASAPVPSVAFSTTTSSSSSSSSSLASRLYPEALLWRHLRPSPWPCSAAGSCGLRGVLAAEGEAGERPLLRDPWAKLREDFARSACSFPPPPSPGERESAGAAMRGTM